MKWTSVGGRPPSGHQGLEAAGQEQTKHPPGPVTLEEGQDCQPGPPESRRITSRLGASWKLGTGAW